MAYNVWITIDNELRSMWTDVVVAYFRIVSRICLPILGESMRNPVRISDFQRKFEGDIFQIKGSFPTTCNVLSLKARSLFGRSHFYPFDHTSNCSLLSNLLLAIL